MIDDAIDSLPSGYIPYETLVLCSNRLSVRVPLMLKGIGAPLLIGKGDRPRIWMAVTANAPKQDFFYIVRDNLPVSPQVQVVSDGETISITAGEVVMCQVKQVSEDEAEVIKLDLRPTGLLIYGNSEGLWIGGNKMSKSQFVGSPVAIMIDSN